MSNAAKKSQIYETVVVGSGLSGLLVAKALFDSGSEVALIESSEFSGGHNRLVQTKIGPRENGLRFLPNSEIALSSLEFLSELLQEKIEYDEVEHEPSTFENGSLRPFVGFGEDRPEFYDEMSYFLNPKQLLLKKSIAHWVSQLASSFKGEFIPRSYVTKFHQANGKIHSLTINGQKTLSAQNVIYAGPLKSLGLLLPEEVLSARARQKFTKSKFWTAIGLDLIHPKRVTELPNLHLLNGTTQDDLGPCVGRFEIPEHETEPQLSQWLSFLDDEDAEDTEKVGAALKKMKRQIKRAYPDALEGLVSERITALPSFAGHGDLKLNANQTLPQANNFWIASGVVNPQKNLVGSLAQAQLVVSSFSNTSKNKSEDVGSPNLASP